ncbi:hypothetical protein [Streptomyces sp. NPDC059597]|uniref:hypothetical protein n=1 Tax=Streptomyces sp. NPDC059597 TaxID=3346879 RepID=UPI003685C4C6
MRSFVIGALRLVAASADEQAGWVRSHGVVTDEIALDLEHATGVAPGLVAAGVFGEAVLAGLRKIDAVFGEMSGDPDRWSLEALGGDEGWGRARGLARGLLEGERLGLTPLPEVHVIR